TAGRTGATGSGGGRGDAADAAVRRLRRARTAPAGLARARDQTWRPAAAGLRLVRRGRGALGANHARGWRRRRRPHRAHGRFLRAAWRRQSRRRVRRFEDVGGATGDPAGPDALHDLLLARAGVRGDALPGRPDANGRVTNEIL